MTQTKATIVLNRLVIMKGDKSVYDENYHMGANIIRSHGNSTGKTTIMDAIFFVLGGDVEDWTNEAMGCDCVVAEISFRKKILTFRREIGSSRFPPIYIYEGPYAEAVKNSLKYESGNARIDSVSGARLVFRFSSSSLTLLSGIADSSLRPPSARTISSIRCLFGATAFSVVE